jgi:Integrase core domain
MFERICHENGITPRLTKPRSPTTTGKVERLHQRLQRELLNVHGPFASIEDAQAAVDTWRKDYNTRRPHQSLNMAFPAARFPAAADDAIGLRVPAELTRPPQLPAAGEDSEPDDGAAPPPDPGSDTGQAKAVELDRISAGTTLWSGSVPTTLNVTSADRPLVSPALVSPALVSGDSMSVALCGSRASALATWLTACRISGSLR